MLHLLRSTNASALRRRTFCSAKEQLAKEAAQAEKERSLESLCMVRRQAVCCFPWGQVIFTAFILGSYVAYVKMIEEPLDATGARSPASQMWPQSSSDYCHPGRPHTSACPMAEC